MKKQMKMSSIAIAVAMAFGASLASAQTCALPDSRSKVFVGTIDSGVTNVDIDGAGPSTCTVNDRINTAATYSSQAAFVAAVTSAMASIAVLDQTQRNAIIAAATAFDVRRFRPVKLIGFNDLHGNLESPGGSPGSTFFGVPNIVNGAVNVGGVEWLAGYAQAIRAKNPGANFMVHAGDLVGATPLISALFLDEPTIEAMNLVGVNLGADALGNHEFDKGKDELLRLDAGGCATDPAILKDPFRTCQGPTGTFAGAQFPFISSNVFTESGATLVPPYTIRVFNGVRVAFIAAVTETTPTIVTPTGVAGLTFADEADSVNALVGQLRNRGVEAIVMVVHEGGTTTGQGTNISGCGNGLSGDIVNLVSRLDNAVDLIVSGHTHQAHVCTLPNKTGRQIPVTQASSFGRALSEIDIWLDTRTRDVVKVDARNLVIDRRNAQITPDPQVAALVSHYKTASAPLANRVIGRISTNATRTTNAACEQQAGDLIAEAQRVATASPGFGDAVVAFMNPGGVRADFTFAQVSGSEAPGELTYGESFTVQPFGNSLVTMTLTGRQIYDVLAQQFTGCPNNQTFNRVMQVSAGFEYQWDNTRGIVPSGETPTLANCSRIVPDSVKINGVPVALANSYRVTMNNFMSTGGDNYTVFNQGTNRLGGALDIDALANYLRTTQAPGAPYTPPALTRILRADAGASCPTTR